MFDVKKILMFELILYTGPGSDFNILICRIRSRIRPKMDRIRNPGLHVVLCMQENIPVREASRLTENVTKRRNGKPAAADRKASQPVKSLAKVQIHVK